MDYQQKYLKYKNKYLELKKEIYGGLRVDDTGRGETQSTLALPKTITDGKVFRIDRAEGRCLVVGCQCAGYESHGNKSIGMMEDPHGNTNRGRLADIRADPYKPKIFERECKHCEHNLGSHALKKGVNIEGNTVNFISYKGWIEYMIDKGKNNLDQSSVVSLYDFKDPDKTLEINLGTLKKKEKLGLQDNEEVKEIAYQKEGMNTGLYWEQTKTKTKEEEEDKEVELIKQFNAPIKDSSTINGTIQISSV